MKYELTTYHTINIANKTIDYNSEVEINNTEIFNDKICVSTRPTDKDLNWNNIESHDVWKKRCEKFNGSLYCYNKNGELIWELTNKNIIGFGKINLEQKRPDEFINIEHYKNYLNRFIGLEIIEAIIGGWPTDTRLIINVVNGDILDSSISK
jgi:hypothetical protein